MNTYWTHKSANSTQLGDNSWKIACQLRQISEKMFFLSSWPRVNMIWRLISDAVVQCQSFFFKQNKPLDVKACWGYQRVSGSAELMYYLWSPELQSSHLLRGNSGKWVSHLIFECAQHPRFTWSQRMLWVSTTLWWMSSVARRHLSILEQQTV